jgi:hypothetical protein
MVFATAACGHSNRSKLKAERDAYEAQREVDERRLEAVKKYERCVEKVGNKRREECQHHLDVAEALGN